MGIVYTYTGCGVEYQLFGDCTYCSVRGVWTSTIWGFYTGLLGDCTGCRAHHWLGVKKNILAERRGNLLGNICKEYDITATKHRPVSYEERTIREPHCGCQAHQQDSGDKKNILSADWGGGFCEAASTSTLILLPSSMYLNT